MTGETLEEKQFLSFPRWESTSIAHIIHGSDALYKYHVVLYTAKANEYDIRILANMDAIVNAIHATKLLRDDITETVVLMVHMDNIWAQKRAREMLDRHRNSVILDPHVYRRRFQELMADVWFSATWPDKLRWLGPFLTLSRLLSLKPPTEVFTAITRYIRANALQAKPT